MEINLSPRSMIIDLFVVDTESTTGNPRHYAGTFARDLEEFFEEELGLELFEYLDYDLRRSKSALVPTPGWYNLEGNVYRGSLEDKNTTPQRYPAYLSVGLCIESIDEAVVDRLDELASQFFETYRDYDSNAVKYTGYRVMKARVIEAD